MIEINLDSTDRRNNKIIIDGEDICKKYKVTGFNLEYNASELPILSLKIFDDNIKINSDCINIYGDSNE